MDYSINYNKINLLITLALVVIMLSLNSCHFKAVFHQFSPFTVHTNISLFVHQGECRQASINHMKTVLFLQSFALHQREKKKKHVSYRW